MEFDSPTELSDMPNEMLEEIFNHLQNPKDFLTVISTCRLWYDIMAYKKTERLFGMVLPVILKTVSAYEVSRMLVGLLGSRGVCRKWREDTNKELEKLNDESDFFSDNYYFDTTERMMQMNAHSASLPRESNPFLGKCITVAIDEEVGVCEPFLQLTARHGHQVKRVELQIYNEHSPVNELVANLGQMPNLEAVNILIRRLVENEITPPPLAHLRKLTISTPWHQNNLVVSSFVTSYGNQLTALTAPLTMLRIVGIGNMLPNLTCLSIDSLEDNNDSGLSDEDLQVLTGAEWKLEDLDLYDLPVLPTENFFAALNNFRETLINLGVSIRLDQGFVGRPLTVFSQLADVRLQVATTLPNMFQEIHRRLDQFASFAPKMKHMRLDLTLRGTIHSEDVSYESADYHFEPPLIIIYIHNHGQDEEEETDCEAEEN